MEGSGCVCHREHNCLGGALSVESIKSLLKNIKDICAHFYRSDKVHSHCDDCFPLKLYTHYYVVACRDFLDYASLEGSRIKFVLGLPLHQKPVGHVFSHKLLGLMSIITSLLFTRKPEKQMVLDDGTMFQNYILSDYD